MTNVGKKIDILVIVSGLILGAFFVMSCVVLFAYAMGGPLK